MRILSRIRYDIDMPWLKKFKDVGRLHILNYCIKQRYRMNTNWYKAYIEKFYYDKRFNKLYNKWILSGKDKYLKPSLDHIRPVSRGGRHTLCNLRFVTNIENKCRSNIPDKDWKKIKKNIKKYFCLTYDKM